MLPATSTALSTGLAGAILLAAALHDVAFRTVPNWMSIVLCGLGLTLRAAQGDLVFGAGAGGAVFLAATWCWQRGWMGGGDVKLLAASAILVPPSSAFQMVLFVAVAGGVLALTYLTLSRLVTAAAPGRPTQLLPRIWRAERRRIQRRGPLPYASAIAGGALLVLLKG